ncbi:MAG: sigma-B regulation protein RsbU (phosphoserine phosphatase) [Moritella sp.]|jgi:sigma-B regulation protein RsbU (phosphoserine phosphatase)
MDNILFESKQYFTIKTPHHVRHALEKITQIYIPHVSVRQRVQLCVSEAVTNLVLHAEPKSSQIILRFGSDTQGWWLDIFDDSNAWDPTKRLDDNLLSEFSEIEQGRGIALLHSQCDNITYYSGEGSEHNQLRLTWAFPKQKRQHTILLVEDNNCLRLLYQNYLSSSFKVLTANNGHEALAKLDAYKIDLVLSDIKMPQMNGLSLRKRINQHPSSELIPFIFLTAEDDELIQKQAAELGIDDYLIKPVDRPQLLKIIRRVLGRSTQVCEQLTERITDRIDKRITASLKPNLPDISHGWRCVVASRDTGSGGGDLLLHKSSENMLQLVLTDIMGHDDSAKFFAHACGGYIHGLMQSMETNNNPAQLLEQLSQFAQEDKLLSQVTLTCCSVQLSTGGDIRVASAGHPAPLLISPQDIIPLPTGGALLGLLPNTNYHSTQINVKDGDRIAIFTDGLFESAADNNARSELKSRIFDALSSTLNMPIAQSLQRVMALFDELTGSQPSDDALLLLLEPLVLNPEIIE